jgi:hypothetical protein
MAPQYTSIHGRNQTSSRGLARLLLPALTSLLVGVIGVAESVADVDKFADFTLKRWYQTLDEVEAGVDVTHFGSMRATLDRIQRKIDQPQNGLKNHSWARRFSCRPRHDSGVPKQGRRRSSL